MGFDLLEMLELLGKQGHSDFSYKKFIKLFNKLSDFKSITKLTGEDDEWVEKSKKNIGTDEEEITYQNKRCSSIFKKVKKDGSVKCFYIYGKIFKVPDGGCNLMGSNSWVPITFPCFSPETIIVDITQEEYDNYASGKIDKI